MTATKPDAADRCARWPTRAGFWRGAALSLPLAPGVFFFGAAFGTIAAQKGLTFAEAMLMTGLLYAGASQFAALEIWPQHWTPAAMAAIVAVVALVNARLFLMSAAMRPWLGGLPAAFVYPQFLLLSEANYVVGVRYRAAGGEDAGVFLGAAVANWAMWTASAAPGYALGAMIRDPARYGLDLVMPMMFAAMIAPLWKSHRDSRNWAIAGAAALALLYVAPGPWVILGGAAAGMLAAAFLDGEARR